MKQLNKIFGLSALVLLTGCSTFSASTVLKMGTENADLAPVQMTIRDFPGVLLLGQAQKDSSGNWKVALTYLHWFNNWANGWTDADFLLEGAFSLEKSGKEWEIQMESAPLIAVVDKASVRYFDSYLVADRALEQFSRRWDRIQAITELLDTKFPNGWWNDKKSVERFLFPEIFGYPSGELPGKTVMTDSIAWDVGYSAVHFPENLRPLRDSGTLLRDFKESPGLWELSSRWKSYWEHAAAVTLVEKK